MEAHVAVGHDLLHSSPPGIWQSPQDLQVWSTAGAGVFAEVWAKLREGTGIMLVWSSLEFSAGPGAHIAPLLGRVGNPFPPSWGSLLLV